MGQPMNKSCGKWWLGCLVFLGSSMAWAQGLGLTQAMQESLARYPTIRASQSQKASALAEQEKAEGARWPVLSVGGGVAQQSGAGSSTRSATPQATYVLYAGGSIEAGVARAEHLVRVADGKLKASRDEVAQQAGEAYLQWARGLEQLALARKNMRVLQLIRDDVQSIVEVDKGRMVDLNQAEVRVRAGALTVSHREVELEQARLRLTRYLESGVPAEPSGLDAVPFVVPGSVDLALAGMGEDHPVMVQALAQLEAARAGVTIAKAQVLPRVDLSVSRQINPYLLNSNTLSQFNVSMPVFNGGAGQAGVRGAEEQLNVAQQGLEEQVLVLREKISSAWAEWRMAAQRAELGLEQTRSGEQLVENYRLQFKLARRTLLDLLNVQNESFGYQAAALQAQYDVRIARLKLASAMGRLANSLTDTAVPAREMP